MTEKLYYIPGNRDIPRNTTSSTARRGDKWYGLVDVGDRVELVITGTEEKFGEAVIVCKELLTYEEVLEGAAHNHVAYGPAISSHVSARCALQGALESAYGTDINLEETFTVLHIVCINNVTNKDDLSAINNRTGEMFRTFAEYGVRGIEFSHRVGDIEESTFYDLG